MYNKKQFYTCHRIAIGIELNSLSLSLSLFIVICYESSIIKQLSKQ